MACLSDSDSTPATPPRRPARGSATLSDSDTDCLEVAFSPAAAAQVTAELITARAALLRQRGVYVGFFEWIAWSALRQKRVFMIFGTESQISDFYGSARPLAEKR